MLALAGRCLVLCWSPTTTIETHHNVAEDCAISLELVSVMDDDLVVSPAGAKIYFGLT